MNIVKTKCTHMIGGHGNKRKKYRYSTTNIHPSFFPVLAYFASDYYDFMAFWFA